MKATTVGGTTLYVGGHYEVLIPQETVIGEVGQVDDLTHTPRTVILSRAYANPVVFAQPLSRNGGDTAVIRITDVQGDRFTFFVDEATSQQRIQNTTNWATAIRSFPNSL